jgi:hypothetical protein
VRVTYWHLFGVIVLGLYACAQFIWIAQRVVMQAELIVCEESP